MIAISIASDKGLDLVTSEDHIHYALATKNTNAVYTSMLKHQIQNAD